jgi:hypothetical protein
MEDSPQAALVLAADDPYALATFYGSLLGCTPVAGMQAHHWRLPWSAGGWLEIYRPSRARPQPRHGGRLALCLRRVVADGAAAGLATWIVHAEALGARRLEEPRVESFGAEVWLLDPEGNRLLLLSASDP